MSSGEGGGFHVRRRSERNGKDMGKNTATFLSRFSNDVRSCELATLCSEQTPSYSHLGGREFLEVKGLDCGPECRERGEPML